MWERQAYTGMANIIKLQGKRFNWLQLGIIVSVLTIILVAAFFFFKPQITAPPRQDSTSTAAQEAQKNFTEADKAATAGDYAKGQTILDDALSNAVSNQTATNTTTTNSSLSDIYLQKATLALNNLQNQDAVTFAKKAEALNPTRITATVLAQAAEQVGDKALALQYYTLVVARTTEQEQQLAPDDFAYYQSKVKELTN